MMPVSSDFFWRFASKHEICHNYLNSSTVKLQPTHITHVCFNLEPKFVCLMLRYTHE